MSAGGSAHVRLELGAFVLGALDPAEQRAVEAHLAVCGACRAELAELAPLAGLLARVPAEDVDPVSTDGLRGGTGAAGTGTTGTGTTGTGAAGTGTTGTGATPARPAGAAAPDLVAAVMARAAHVQHRDRVRRVRRRVAVGAGSLVALAVVAAIVTGRPGDGTPLWGPAAPTPVVVTASDATTGVSGEVTLVRSPGGTDVALRLDGVPAGAECRLVAQSGADRDVTASWEATYSGEATFTGSTRFAVDDIDMLTIETPLGRTLLRLPVG